MKMKETIVQFKKGPFPKKYTALVKNKKQRKFEHCILVIDDMLSTKTVHR